VVTWRVCTHVQLWPHCLRATSPLARHLSPDSPAFSCPHRAVCPGRDARGRQPEGLVHAAAAAQAGCSHRPLALLAPCQLEPPVAAQPRCGSRHASHQRRDGAPAASNPLHALTWLGGHAARRSSSTHGCLAVRANVATASTHRHAHAPACGTHLVATLCGLRTQPNSQGTRPKLLARRGGTHGCARGRFYTSAPCQLGLRAQPRGLRRRRARDAPSPLCPTHIYHPRLSASRALYPLVTGALACAPGGHRRHRRSSSSRRPPVSCAVASAVARPQPTSDKGWTPSPRRWLGADAVGGSATAEQAALAESGGTMGATHVWQSH
jgi:hypothetical protein